MMMDAVDELPHDTNENAKQSAPANDETVLRRDRESEQLLNTIEEEFEDVTRFPVVHRYDVYTGRHLQPHEQITIAFRNFMKENPDGAGVLFRNKYPWFSDLVREVRKTDTDLQFFNDSPTRETALPKQEKKAKGYIYTGVPAIESSESEALQEDARGFYRMLAFWENKPTPGLQKIIEILGKEKFQELQALKKKVAQGIMQGNTLLYDYMRVIEPGMVTSWFTERNSEMTQTTVMTHGVIPPQESAFAEINKEKYKDKVKTLMKDPRGIHVNRPLAGNHGAFFNPGLYGYGNPAAGTKVLFFTDDLLKTHVSVGLTSGDGLVALDATSDTLVEVPQRVLLNPQAGRIVGIHLNDKQMAAYLLEFRKELEAHPKLMKDIEEAGLQYERTVLGKEYLEEAANVQLTMREFGLQESVAVSARVYFTTLILSGDKKYDYETAADEAIVTFLKRTNYEIPYNSRNKRK